MKKSIVFVLLVPLFLSCEKEFEDYSRETEIVYHDDPTLYPYPETRSIDIPNSTEYVPDILDQIWDVPVNIIRKGRHGQDHCPYLTGNLKGSFVGFTRNDDGSGRTQFLIKKNPNFVGGRHTIEMVKSNEFKRPLITGNHNKNPMVPITTEGIIGLNPLSLFKFELANNGYYKIGVAKFGSFTPTDWLQPKSYSSKDVMFSDALNTYESDTWALEPVNKFTFEGIRYFKYAEEGDYMTRVFRNIETRRSSNLGSSVPRDMDVSFTREEEVTATLSQSHGFSISQKVANSSSLKVNGPNIQTDNTLSTEYSMGSSYNLTQTTAQRSKVTFSTSEKIPIPANKYVVVNIYCNFWEAQLTTVAKYRYGNKVIYVKGKFRGAIGNDITIHPEYYDYIP